MSSQRTCSFENCTNLVKFYCECTNPPIDLCETHNSEHQEQEIGLEHSSKNYFIKINARIQERLLDLKQRTIELKKDLKTDIIQKTYESINSITNLSEKWLLEIENQTSSILENIEFFFSIILIPKESRESELIEIYNENFTSEIDLLTEFNLQTIQKFTESLLNKVKSITKSLNTEDSIQKSEFSYVHISDSRTYIKVHNETLETREIQIENIPETIRGWAGVCIKNEEEIIRIGGNSADPRGNYIFNIKRGTFKQIPDFPDVPNRTCVCGVVNFNKSIYVFGGVYKESFFKYPNTLNSYVFEEADNRWVRIRNLPQEMGWIQACVSGNKILLVGTNSSHIVSYRPDIDEYRFVLDLGNICKKNSKLIFETSLGEVVCLVFGQGVYKAEFLELEEWTRVGDCRLKENYIYSEPVEYRGRVYFILYPSNLVEIDIREYEILETPLGIN